MSRQTPAGERSVLDRAEDRWFVDRETRSGAVLLLGGGLFMGAFTIAILILPFSFALVAPLLVVAGVFFLANPRETLVLVLAGRIVFDLLWWAPSLGGIRITEAYSGMIFAIAILLVIVNEERVQRHYFFVPTLVFMIPIAVGTIQDITILDVGFRTNLEFVARVLSPVYLMLLCSTLLTTERLRKAMIYVVPFAALVPLASAVYHYLDGQADVFIFQGRGRLLGGYQNLHHSAHALALFLSIGIFLIMAETRPLRRLAAVAFAAVSGWALYLTYVRTTQVGVLLLIGVLLAAKRRWRLLGAAALVGLPMLTHTTLVQDQYSDLFEMAADGPTYGMDTDALGSGRVGLWKEGVHDYRHRPLLQMAFGKGSKGAHRTHLIRESVDTHNDYLNLLMATGIVGLATYLYFQGTLAWIALSVRRRTDDPWWIHFADFMLALNAMVFAVNLVSNSYVTRFTFGMVFWMLGGVLIAKHADLIGSLDLPPRESGPKRLSHRSGGESLEHARLGRDPQLPAKR